MSLPEIRRVCVTASTAPGFFGFSPYCSPHEEWERHVGIVSWEGNTLTRMGQDLEDGIARNAARELKYGRMERCETLVCDGWAATTPDRLFPKHETGLQIKNHGPYMIKSYQGRPGETGRWDNNLVPKHHLIQCTWEMLVVSRVKGWNITEWILGSYFGGDNLRLYRIRFDPTMAKAIWAAGHDFWREHIDPAGPRKPPHDRPWHVKPERESRRPRKLSDEEILAAPIPFLDGELTT